MSLWWEGSVSVSVVCMSCWSVLCVVKGIRRLEELIYLWAGGGLSTDSVCAPCLLRPRRPSGLGRGGVGQDAALGALQVLTACGLHVSGLETQRRVEAGDAAATTAADLQSRQTCLLCPSTSG